MRRGSRKSTKTGCSTTTSPSFTASLIEIRRGGEMSFDLLIRGGTVVDGSGRPPILADVAVARGQIAEVAASISAGAKRTIDARGMTVTPGFIDPHTHYDAQICWDREVTPSSWHGITTVIMGNCGVGIAPCRPQAREIASWDLVNVEAIPFDVLSRGIS